MTETWTHRPKRGYSWAPFEPGNRAAEKHGAYSPRSWRPLADRIAAELPDVAPWTSRAVFGATIAAWTRIEAQLHLVMDWLDEHGPLDGDGVPRPATALLARLEAQAQSLRGELGLSPLALAKLLNAFSAAPAGSDDDALESLKAEGRRIVESRTVPGVEGSPDAIGGGELVTNEATEKSFSQDEVEAIAGRARAEGERVGRRKAAQEGVDDA